MLLWIPRNRITYTLKSLIAGSAVLLTVASRYSLAILLRSTSTFSRLSFLVRFPSRIRVEIKLG